MSQQQFKKQLKNMTETLKVMEIQASNFQTQHRQSLFYNPKRPTQAMNEYYPDPKVKEISNSVHSTLSTSLRRGGGGGHQTLPDEKPKLSLISDSNQTQQKLKHILNQSLKRNLQSINSLIKGESYQKKNSFKTNDSQSSLQYSRLLSTHLSTALKHNSPDHKGSLTLITQKRSPVSQTQQKKTGLQLNLNYEQKRKNVNDCIQLSEKFFGYKHPSSARNERKLDLAQQMIQKLKQELVKETTSLTYRKQNNEEEQINSSRRLSTHQNIRGKKQMISLKDLPLTGKQTLLKYGNLLTQKEFKEILEYEQVYFIGQNAKKINSPFETNNYGYDNDKGDLIFILGDHISYRYEMIDKLGKGSFGQAFKVFDHKRQQFSALKVIKNKKSFHTQALIEIQILKTIRDGGICESVIKIRDYFLFRNHVCIVFELLNANLYEILKENEFKGFAIDLIRRWAIQLLQCLLHLEKKGIIHCDLKPENILLKQKNKSGIKVIDFGSSCFRDEKIYTYIQSRFYRAPEIILGLNYDTQIDLWSFGCIMIELITGYPIFPSENEQDHMSLIIEVIGIPSKTMIDKSSKKDLFFDQQYKPINMFNQKKEIRYPGAKPIEFILKDLPPFFIEFVSGFLKWDPTQRTTPAQALVHPWILQGLPKSIRNQHLHSMKKEAPYLPIFNDPYLSDYYSSMLSNDTQKEHQGVQGESINTSKVGSFLQ